MTKSESTLAFIIFLIFALHNFAYVYFFPAHEGVSAAPHMVKAVKDVFYLIFIVSLALVLPRKDLIAGWRQWIFAPFVICLAAASLIHAPQTGLAPQLIENIKNIAIYVLVFMAVFAMRPKDREDTTTAFFAVICGASGFQILFSAVHYFAGYKLWDGGLWAGFIGNPNSFALMLNFSLAVCLPLIIKHPILTLAWAAILAESVLYTTSVSQFAIMIGLVIYSAVLQRRGVIHHAAALAVIAAAVFINLDGYGRTIGMLTNARSVVNHPVTPYAESGIHAVEGVSLSVSNRYREILDTWAVISTWPDALIGSLDTPAYRPMDGQFFVLIYNSGLITALAFAIPAAFVYLRTLVNVLRFPGDTNGLTLHLMLTAIGATIVASRVLMYFPFNFLFFLIAGLALARIDARVSEGVQGSRWRESMHEYQRG